MRRIATILLRGLLFFFAIVTPGITHGQSSSAQNDLKTLDIASLRQKAQAGDAIAENEMAGRYFDGSVGGVDFPEAANWFAKSAAQGNASAQAMLGLMYLWGLGVKRDSEVANSWCGKSTDRLQQSAAAGDPDAETNLGRLYEWGCGVKQDYTQARSWYQKAADQGSGWAEDNLGTMYLWGIGGPKDYSLARSWLEKANAKGVWDSPNLLGMIYFNGSGVPKDYAQAHAWFQKAADKGVAAGQVDLANDYFYGSGVKQDYAQARYWYQKAADQGLAEAQNSLGKMYEFGQGGSRDNDSAVQLYQKAADQGDAMGEYNLGFAYGRGISVKKDDNQERFWFQKAAEQGLALAQYGIGSMYVNGTAGLPRDYAQARSWFQKAADQGFPAAQYLMGWLYASGFGVPQDSAQAFAWYLKSANQGYLFAETAVASFYEEGRGVAQNYAQAAYWYRKAGGPGGSRDAQRVEELAKQGSGTQSAVVQAGAGGAMSHSPNCDANWSPKFDSLTSADGMRASIQQKLNGLISQYGGLDGTINEVKSEIASDQNRDDLSDEQRQSLITMNEGIIEVLLCRQSMQQSQMAVSSAQKTTAPAMQAPATNTQPATPSTPQAPTPVDVRFFPNSDSRPLTDAEMRSLQNSLRWDPESAPLTAGGTARSNLVDDKGNTLGSVLVRWEKRAPGSTQATFTIQIQNGTSCFFHSSAELDDPQGFIVVGGTAWAGWLTLNQPSAGETKQAQGRASVNGTQSLSLKPATAYSTLSGCMTPKTQ